MIQYLGNLRFSSTSYASGMGDQASALNSILTFLVEMVRLVVRVSNHSPESLTDSEGNGLVKPNPPVTSPIPT